MRDQLRQQQLWPTRFCRNQAAPQGVCPGTPNSHTCEFVKTDNNNKPRSVQNPALSAGGGETSASLQQGRGKGDSEGGSGDHSAGGERAALAGAGKAEGGRGDRGGASGEGGRRAGGVPRPRGRRSGCGGR